MHVQVDGPADGPVTLLVHGFSSSLHAWDRVVPHLPPAVRVVRVDLLGHGRTGGAAADAPAQARAVAAVLDDLGVTDVTAVGHSFGADVVVELARRSTRVARLVVVAQAPDYSAAVFPRAGWLVTVPRASAALYRAVRPAFRLVAAAADLRGTGGGGPGAAAQALRDLAALDGAMFRVVLVARRARLAARPLDAELTRPTTVLLGARDHFYGDRSAGRYRAAGAQVEVVPDGGHALPLTHAGLVAATVASALDDPAGTR